MLMPAVETGHKPAVGTQTLAPTPALPVSGGPSHGGNCLISTADICHASTADISISIHHSASAFILFAQFWGVDTRPIHSPWHDNVLKHPPDT